MVKHDFQLTYRPILNFTWHRSWRTSQGHKHAVT